MAHNERIKNAWLEQIRAEWGVGPHLACLGSMDHLVEEILLAGNDRHAFLFEFGRRCAVEEFTLADTNAWMSRLVAHAGKSARRLLDHRDAAVAVARGWAEGAGERDYHDSLDVSSMHVLELRLRQQYDRCAALGVRPNDAHALVVFEADIGDAGPSVRDAVIEAMAAEAHSSFRNGETVSATPTGRLVVLTERSPGLATTVQAMLRALNASPGTAGCTVHGWIEPLANERLHLESHVASLSA